MATHVPTANGTEMTGATSLVKSLEAAGVDVMFGLPGGAILPAYDPISIPLFATSWFATNKAQDMRPLVTHKSPVALVSVLQLQDQVLPT